MVDGTVESAPVIRSEIPGGMVSISMGGPDPERRLAEALAELEQLRASRIGG